MKHTLKVTALLALLFFLAQVAGIAVLDNYASYEKVTVNNVTVTKQVWKDLPYNTERPKLKQETSYLPVFIIMLVATAIVIVLMKFRLLRLWRFWFFISVVFCLSIALSAFLNPMLSMAISVVLAFFKVIKRNIIIHNLSELFIYSGLAAIFVPVFTTFSIVVLLILISIYDVIAVWYTKHMVSLAKFQEGLKSFAGLLVPYSKNKTAILGGGDIGFPLMFAGVLMKDYGWSVLVVSLVTTMALVVLLIKGEKGKFYPAMPFLTAGCFLGYFVLKLLYLF